MLDQHKAAYIRQKIITAACMVMLLYYYMAFLVPDSFIGSADFLVLFGAQLLIFLTVCKSLGPWIYHHERWITIRIITAGAFLTITPLMLILIISLCAGRAEWDGGFGSIELGNLAETVFPLLLTYVLGISFYGWKGQLPILEEREEALTAKEEADEARKDAMRKFERLEEKFRTLQLNYEGQEMPPHFLGNSLATVKTLALHDPQKAVEAMSILIDINKTYLLHRKQSNIPLWEEISQITRLILLYQIRKGRPIFFHIDITEDDLEDVLIPMMLLLNAVENCCQYGILTDPLRPANLRVSRLADGAVYILVENEYDGEVLPEVTRSGKGLTQLRERLHLLNPEGNTVEIQDNGNRFRIRITMRTPISLVG
ncbi:sensor histidine kinase [Sphingobacterium pedocola]|nr:histidine kinase [Sphingobacterium pedocola]